MSFEPFSTGRQIFQDKHWAGPNVILPLFCYIQNFWRAEVLRIIAKNKFLCRKEEKKFPALQKAYK